MRAKEKTMLHVTFKFRKPKATTPQIINLVVRFGSNDKLVYNTGLKVLPKYWNTERMRVRSMVEVPHRVEINARLDELQAAVSGFATEQITQGKKPDKYAVRDFLDVYTGKREASTGSGFHDFVREYIQRNEERVNPKTGRTISYKTKREHARVYELLQEFEKEQRGGRLLDFDGITIDFYNDFQAFLQAAGMAKNTIAHKVQTLKVWLNEATAKGLNQNLQYKSSYFKASTEAADTVYLHEEELRKIYATAYDSERLTRTRDLFLAGAYTGLRFSDLTRVEAVNVKAEAIHIEQSKTGDPVVIPLHPIVREIWEKYGEAFPPPISNQKYNAYIKEVCQLAGIDEEIQKSGTRGGQRVREVVPKYKLITSHTARRSFATNLYLSGYPALSIMKITGYKTEQQFVKYVRVTPEQHAKQLQNFWAARSENVQHKTEVNK